MLQRCMQHPTNIGIAKILTTKNPKAWERNNQAHPTSSVQVNMMVV
jgi:hypothetical protein